MPFLHRCTSNDLKCIIRLVKHDLKMNAGAKHVYVRGLEANVLSSCPTLNLFQCFFSHRLDAVDPNAYDAFKASRNLGDVIDRVLKNQQEASNGSGPRKLLTVEASLMTPVQPMLVSSFASHSFTT